MDETRDSHLVKSERERKIPYGITYIWNLIYGTNELSHRKENHGLGEQICGCQGGRGGSGKDWELGVNRCRILPQYGLAMGSCCVALGSLSSHLLWNK